MSTATLHNQHQPNELASYGVGRERTSRRKGFLVELVYEV